MVRFAGMRWQYSLIAVGVVGKVTLHNFIIIILPVERKWNLVTLERAMGSVERIIVCVCIFVPGGLVARSFANMRGRGSSDRAVWGRVCGSVLALKTWVDISID
jgi:hypothetical protein